ncbi:MFS transporter [Novosphingobium piscinae]|uniref:MFS transporter n=1 Tax=Novosphingobium piscinae TaxID=1507448 RepID=A0A7X1FZG6_9SPHN|nr:MFS transporter [Novosphingobium piscinae]MBC2669820.1 MFS transporter [Novosphingobium piscinae]
MEPNQGVQQTIEQVIGRKVIRRLVLPCILFTLMGSIDRTNVGFAALQMNTDLGLSATAYGFGAGILFVGYVLAKYPSVRLYETIGFRRWLATITLAWGLAACLLALIQTQGQLYLLRVLIGFAEGGLSSGLMLYLGHWAPERWRATILAVPIMSINVSQVIGGPLSGLLLDMDNPLGIAGWRFMFLVEALPAVALAVFAWCYFPDRPADAAWLDAAERQWLRDHVHAERRKAPGGDGSGRWEALRSRSGWLCALIWFCILASNYGVMFWLPTIVKGLSGLTATQTGLIVALPNAAAAVGLLINARHSDRTGERFLHIALPALVGGFGLLGALLLGPGPGGLALLILGGACTGCTVAAFWAVPTRILRPEALAMGVVMINMLGSFAGALIPPAMGALREASGSYLPPTLLITGIACLLATLCLITRAQIARSGATP